jgi:hypothetical protein
MEPLFFVPGLCLVVALMVVTDLIVARLGLDRRRSRRRGPMP